MGLLSQGAAPYQRRKQKVALLRLGDDLAWRHSNVHRDQQAAAICADQSAFIKVHFSSDELVTALTVDHQRMMGLWHGGEGGSQKAAWELFEGAREALDRGMC